MTSYLTFSVFYFHFTSIILPCGRDSFQANNGGGLLLCALLLDIHFKHNLTLLTLKKLFHTLITTMYMKET